MDLMEYQGKELFRRYDVPTPPPGEVAAVPEEAARLAERFAVPVMVKAQVLTGGRGKAGGVAFCQDPTEARASAERILGMDIRGHRVDKVLVEPASDIAEEYYLAVLHDRVGKGYKVVCSAEGGVDIEEVNRRSPEKVVKVDVDPTKGLDPGAARQIVAMAGLPRQAREQAAGLLLRLYAGFVDADATLFEVNPLVLTAGWRVLALDAKVSVDGNALFRHPDFAAWDDPSAADPLEARARKLGLQYVRLDGDIGVLGNGAGLVMSTLDVVSQAGGRPANFLDVGGGADADTMAESLALVLSDERVASVLVNIFGGITRCDLIARGVLEALRRLDGASHEAVSQKLVVRLDGTNAEEGRRILAEAAHPSIVAAATMIEAAEQAVALAHERHA
ncbi:MAG TPA: ADP-forming succinate--CoA ligase subunit beta [Egibacteraceae bacterium]|nr:ADP-forming succinate--CoA ligase subunit beta [Actinomycetota bacterium]HWB72265.1 ADP-forming succinate--CoA ligase subunit beta [Egibacteraceae bacterium]